jgi:hypothetical protein
MCRIKTVAIPYVLIADVQVERSCQRRRDKWLHKAVQPDVTRPVGEAQPEEYSRTTARWLDDEAGIT